MIYGTNLCESYAIEVMAKKEASTVKDQRRIIVEFIRDIFPSSWFAGTLDTTLIPIAEYYEERF